MNLQEPLTKTLDKSIITFIEECKSKANSESFLISILHKVQGKYGYLSQEHMQEVAETLGVPASTVSGVATFYHFFRLTPRGKYNISVCMGTACYVKGADKVVEEFKDHLGIAEGETTPDMMYSLEITRCVGVCGLAPVVIVNDKVYGKVAREQVPGIIAELRKIDEEQV
ncbi:MAG: NADH-quinone oxidoreductase subunit NuoE [Spirochaetes bacterium]|nr:NADH-quinone oxidoreductase subunit NuoE [Spirochaetota bacterium]